MSGQTQPPAQVFISYSHKDREWLERLRVHLKPLRGTLDFWDDTRIRPGDEWRAEIHAALAAARVAVLLISADFVASDFIIGEELPALLRSARADGTELLIVILSPAMLSAVEGLSDIQSVNDPREPLIGMDKVKREQVFLQVATLAEVALRRRQTAPPPPPAAGDAAPAPSASTPPPSAGCRDYATIFDIHARREQRAMPLAYAALVLTPLVGLALILTAWLSLDPGESPAVFAAAVAVGLVSFGLAYVLMNKVRDRYASIDFCEYMKKRFDGCDKWDQGQLGEHVRLALDFLRKGMLRS